MDPHFQVQDTEIKVFAAIRTLGFWISNICLNKPEFWLCCEEQEMWRFEHPDFKNVCITFWRLLMDDKKNIIKLASKAKPSRLSWATGQVLCQNSHCNISALSSKASGNSELVLVSRKANQQELHLVRDEKRSSLPFRKTRITPSRKKRSSHLPPEMLRFLPFLQENTSSAEMAMCLPGCCWSTQSSEASARFLEGYYCTNREKEQTNQSC